MTDNAEPIPSGTYVEPFDDPTLEPGDGVLRRIRHDVHTYFDENLQAQRISTAAFSATSRDPDNGMSIDIEKSITASGADLTAMLGPETGAVRLRVGALRALGLKVGADPIPLNPHHGQAWGVTSTMRKKVARSAECWVVPLPGVRLR